MEVAACPIVALAFLPAAFVAGGGDDGEVWQVRRAPSLRQDWQSYDRTASPAGKRRRPSS